jgi:hypothetical protein
MPERIVHYCPARRGVLVPKFPLAMGGSWRFLECLAGLQLDGFGGKWDGRRRTREVGGGKSKARW